jgi:glycosyltransferase involved in cell wall biosynthesis
MGKNKSKFIERWKEELEKSHLSKKDSEKRNYERTGKNPTILYIDQEPPNDYACGSKLSKLYCNLLSEMGFHVKYLPMHVSKSNQKYIQDLEVKGIECCVIETSKGRLSALDPWTGPLHQTSFETWFKSKSEVFDYYLLARPSSYKYLNIIQTHQPDAKYFYHPADLHFLREEREKLFSKKHKKDATKSSILYDPKTIELTMLKNAQKVLHVSTYENNLLKKEYGINNGIIIPCLFFDSDNKRNDNSIRKDLVYIGSNHHASSDGINWFLDEIFPSILDVHPDTIINIAGSCGTKISQNKNIKTLGKVSEDGLKQLYQTCIAIIPLRYGAGVKGKVLEAMNYQTPFVSTNIGLEGIKGVNRAKKGIDAPKEFACEVCNILTDSRYQDTEIEKCYEIILQNYTKKSAQTTLESIF